jgi:hypothetical protein
LIRTCHETLRGSAEGEALLAEIVANDKRPDDAWVRKETKRTEEKKRKGRNGDRHRFDQKQFGLPR